MIVVVLQGGLGNQMFQYAAGRSLSALHHTELLLSVHGLTARRGQTRRAFALGALSTNARLCEPLQEREIALALRLRRFARLATPWRVHIDREVGFDSTWAQVPDFSVLRGYWQSEKYFAHIRKQIAEELTPPDPLPPQHERWRQQIASTASVSVHVRRGDYVSLAKAASFHGSLPLSYYAQAVERIRRIEPSPVCYVFTDDPAWCRVNLRLHACEMHHVSDELVSSPVQDLTLMRSCRHHIIANSSFSWWGAWLAGDGSQNGIVIAPRHWFAGRDDLSSIADRFPPHWEVL